ncbi:MAG: MerR family transcriptional regulator [Actinobacteria bacterium]|nr:MerR family transcriptional regulator [Actinomycetota bacterium]NBY15783.1 MerR family transcriptional regulator [Actinomycetota bacterium]
MTEFEGTAPESIADEVARAQAQIVAEEQGLFADQTPISELSQLGFRGPVAAGVVGITYRQLDYWARTGLVEPTVRPATGSGTSRLYGFRDILELKVVKRLLDAGVSLQQIRTAIEYLRTRGIGDLTQITLMSDGVSVYACMSADEIIDLLAHGQAVFGIAIGGVWREVAGSLSHLPSERTVLEAPMSNATDELSLRRKAREGA